MKILFEGGHGKHTAGKRTPDDEREWSFNNVNVLAFAEQMAKYGGVELKRADDPTGERDVPLAERVDMANDWKADIYISFHHNALAGKWGTHTGVQVHVYETKPWRSVELAQAVLPAVVEAYDLRNRGIIANNLYVTRETNMPAILIEGGFMDSTIDIVKLRDKSVLKAAGVKVADAVAKLYKLEKKVVEPTPLAEIHEVKSGDTLWGISREYGVTVAEIRAWNNLTTDTINVGQELIVKKPKAVVAKKSTPTPVKKASKPASTGIKAVGNIKIVNLNNFTYIYSKPNANSTRIGEAKKNAKFPIAGSVPGWFEVIYKGKRCYIKDKYGKRV